MARISRDIRPMKTFFDPEYPPVFHAEIGDIVVVETLHSFSPFKRDITEEDTFLSLPPEQINPLTGPIYVNGAEPGDTLVVDILSIDITSEEGYMPLCPDFGHLREHVNTPIMRVVPIRRGLQYFSDDLIVPIKPMIGCIGTTPTETIGSCPAGRHGGNLDDPSFATGARLYFPVFVPGGLLSMGDIHASQGDSEWSGPVEVDGDITIRIVDVLKGYAIPVPRVETEERWIINAVGTTMGEAIDNAGKFMADFATEKLEISIEDAALLFAMICDMRITRTTTGDDEHVARAELPKWIDRKNRL
jgi:amidase